jgi:hypothetical protein
MKIIKGISIFIILSAFIILSGCTSEPKFSEIPEIEIKQVDFVVTPSIEDYDTLSVILTFKDGDGNLGLPTNDPEYLSAPFNEVNFFLEEGNNQAFNPITTQQVVIDDHTTITVIDPGETKGHLVTLHTRDKPGYDALLPPYEVPFTRTKYTFGTYYVHKSDLDIFNTDPKLTPVDTIDGIFFGLNETFYTESNDNYYNIDVTFEVRKNDTYVPFDWGKTARIVSPARGRFPVLSDVKRPLEGELTYAIAYPDFLIDFKNQAVRLNVQIKDRALNKSNVAYSREFTLN